jgi:hypothetical protein
MLNIFVSIMPQFRKTRCRFCALNIFLAKLKDTYDAVNNLPQLLCTVRSSTQLQLVREKRNKTISAFSIRKISKGDEISC